MAKVPKDMKFYEDPRKELEKVIDGSGYNPLKGDT